MRWLALVGWLARAAGQSPEIMRPFNSGARLTCGSVGRRVYVDTFFRGVDGYQRPDATDVAAMETGAPPYDGDLVILVTHSHADRFDSGLVARPLASNAKAVLAATGQIARPLRARFPGQVTVVARGGSWRAPGVEVRLLDLAHSSPERWARLENSGLLIRYCGQTVFHPGDADTIAANFRRELAGAPPIDVALVPEWFLAQRRGDAVMEIPKPRRTYGLHGDLGDLSWVPLMRQRYPEAVIPEVFLRRRQ